MRLGYPQLRCPPSQHILRTAVVYTELKHKLNIFFLPVTTKTKDVQHKCGQIKSKMSSGPEEPRKQKRPGDRHNDLNVLESHASTQHTLTVTNVLFYTNTKQEPAPGLSLESSTRRLEKKMFQTCRALVQNFQAHVSHTHTPKRRRFKHYHCCTQHVTSTDKICS